MNVVCVPYRPDTPERVANWNRTRGQWDGWMLVDEDSEGETFGRAQACNRAAARAGEWDAAVFADSDLLLEDVAQAAMAVELARRTDGYIVCYDTFYYLDEPATKTVRSGATPEPAMAYYSLTKVWLGMFAIARSLWDALSGFDERFKSWGGEDGDFLTRVNGAGATKARVAGSVYHLKHPLAPGAR